MNDILAQRFFFYVSTSTQVLDNFPATSTKFPTSTKVRHAEPFNQPTNKKTTAPLGGAPLTNPWVSEVFVVVPRTWELLLERPGDPARL